MIILITIISHQLGCALQSKWYCVSSGFPDYQKKKWNPAISPKTNGICVCVCVVVVVAVSFFPGAKQNDEKSTRTTTQQKKGGGCNATPRTSTLEKKKCGSEDTCVHRTFTHKHTDSHSEPSKKREREREEESSVFICFLFDFLDVRFTANQRPREEKNATLPLEGRQLAGPARALKRERERGTVSERRGEDQWGSECKSIN